jgi:hypothetical protein
MVKIYALVSGQLVLYVGKTTKTLKQRESGHRCKSNASSSRYIPNYIDWTIKLLEEVADDQGVTKEQHYYDILKPLYNGNRPGQTLNQYYQTNKAKDLQSKFLKSEAGKQYRQSERYKQLQKEGYLRRKAERDQS